MDTSPYVANDLIWLFLRDCICRVSLQCHKSLELNTFMPLLMLVASVRAEGHGGSRRTRQSCSFYSFMSRQVQSLHGVYIYIHTHAHTHINMKTAL